MHKNHYFNPKTASLLWVLLVSFALFLNRAAGAGNALNKENEIKIIETTSHSLTFDFHLINLRADSVKIDGRLFYRFSFLDKSSDFSPNRPELPFAVLPVGIPPGAHAKISVLGTETKQLFNSDVVPTPQWKKVNGLHETFYKIPGDYFNKDQFTPSQIAKVVDTGFMEDLFLARIKISPIQYNPARHSVKIYTKMRIRILFTGGKKADRTEFLQSTGNLNPYDGAVINLDQAKKWIIPPPRKTLRKPIRFWGSGVWYKFPVYKNGIYKITGKFLKDNGINISTIDPKTLKIYNNGGKALPRGLNAPRPDSLLENAIYLVDGNDGHFDENDYFLFYGRSVTGWNYKPEDTDRPWQHYLNPYTKKDIYWLTFNDGETGKRMQTVSAAPESGLPELTQFKEHVFWEEEIYNPLHSGMIWFGMNFLGQDEKSLTVLLPDLVSGSEINAIFQMYSFTSEKQHINWSLNSNSASSKAFYAYRLKDLYFKNILGAKSGENELAIKYEGKNPTSQLYLDWIEFEYPRRLSLKNGALFFNTPVDGRRYRWAVSGVTESSTLLFDVTDFRSVRLLSDWTLSQKNLQFSLATRYDKPLRLMAVEPKAFQTPGSLIKDETSDLRNRQNGADFLIITHSNFYNAAMGLKNLRETHGRMATTVVKIEDVYDEFSGGMFDPTAIRDFLKYVYFNWNKRPQYVLLFGDGDYDYKNIIGNADENWIPAYEDSSLAEYTTRTTDDWYAYVNGTDHLVDYSIGRIPSQTTDQAENVLNKIVNYESNPDYGPWRNTVTIVADDEFGDLSQGNDNELMHVLDAEDIAEHYYPPLFNKKKIYLMEYPLVLSPAGRRKPAAENDFVQQINKGCLMINYLGHGNERLLAHERVIQISKDLPRIINAGRLAFWIAATCAFGRYDMPEEQSMAEQLMTEADNGAIALLSASRDAFAQPNADFNKRYLSKLFITPHRTRRIGDALRLTKISAINIVNDEKYWLCGDPTLNLAVPRLKVELQKISPDSLKALSKILVTGSVLDKGQIAADFNGKVDLKAFDSKRPTAYTTARGSTVHFILPGRPIFRGEGKITNGRFSMQFIVPKDISYGGNLGRISAYIWNDQIDGSGYKDNIAVDGTAKGLVDHRGPKIQIGFKNQNFMDGDLLAPDPVMEVTLTDEQSGINIAGDIGHKITLILDNNPSTKRNITDYFQYNVGSYFSGKLEYPLTDIKTGFHSAEIKAWDNSNNSSTQTVHFTITPQNELIVQRLYPYPNPFENATTLSFEINQPAQISLKIYTLSGRLIAELPVYDANAGFNTMRWDGHDQDGDEISNGVYLFKFQASAEKLSFQKIGKFIKMK